MLNAITANRETTGTQRRQPRERHLRCARSRNDFSGRISSSRRRHRNRSARCALVRTSERDCTQQHCDTVFKARDRRCRHSSNGGSLEPRGTAVNTDFNSITSNRRTTSRNWCRPTQASRTVATRCHKSGRRTSRGIRSCRGCSARSTCSQRSHSAYTEHI